MIDAHPVGPGREQARRAGPRRRPVLPPRLQHRLARGRPDRAPRDLADHVVVNVEELPLEQVTKQLNKLDQRHQDRRARRRRRRCSASCCWSRCAPTPRPAAQVLETVQLFRAKVVDVAPDAVTIEVTGNAGQARRAARACSSPSASASSSSPAWSPSAAAPRSITDRALEPGRRSAAPPDAAHPSDLEPKHQPKESPPWLRCSTTTTPTCPLIQGKKVAVLGYGSQGHAHALNLRDSGVDVRVGLPEGSKSRAKAEAEGLRVRHARRGRARRPTSSSILAPDHVPARRSTPRPSSPTSPTATRWSSATASTSASATSSRPRASTSCMVAPEGPGPPGAPRVRRRPRRARCSSRSSRTPPATPGRSRCPTPRRIGGLRAGGIKTTFTEETETDLFGEQAVLCGGASQLVQYGFETLTEAGYQPEVAYFECLHELKLIVDLMYEGGIAKQRWSVSDTAEYGDYVSGPRVIDAARQGEHAGRARRHPVRRVRRSASSPTRTPAPRSSRSCAPRASSTRSRQTGRELRKLMAWVKSPRRRLRRGHRRPLRAAGFTRYLAKPALTARSIAR